MGVSQILVNVNMTRRCTPAKFYQNSLKAFRPIIFTNRNNDMYGCMHALKHYHNILGNSEHTNLLPCNLSLTNFALPGIQNVSCNFHKTYCNSIISLCDFDIKIKFSVVTVETDLRFLTQLHLLQTSEEQLYCLTKTIGL